MKIERTITFTRNLLLLGAALGLAASGCLANVDDGHLEDTQDAFSSDVEDVGPALSSNEDDATTSDNSDNQGG